MSVACFMLERTGEVRLSLRRWTDGSQGWTCEEGWHHAEVVIGTAPDEGRSIVSGTAPPQGYEDDERWPTTCERCDYAFAPDDRWQVQHHALWQRADGQGEPVILDDAPPGAMWDADWMPEPVRGPDGRYLMVVTPDGYRWAIDGQSSNCTRVGEDHDCWCRHGQPPNITVDKNPAPGRSTCHAGAGSIATPDWHGFLREGVLTP